MIGDKLQSNQLGVYIPNYQDFLLKWWDDHPQYGEIDLRDSVKEVARCLKPSKRFLRLVVA